MTALPQASTGLTRSLGPTHSSLLQALNPESHPTILFDCPLCAVVGSEKGVVVGRLTFYEDGDAIDCTRMGVGGKAIPPNIEKVRWGLPGGAACQGAGLLGDKVMLPGVHSDVRMTDAVVKKVEDMLSIVGGRGKAL